MPFIEALRQLSFSLGIAGVYIIILVSTFMVLKPCITLLRLVCQSYTLHFFLEEKTSFFFSGYRECDPYTFIYFLGKENFCLIHVSLVPVLGVVGEQVNNSSFNGNDEFCLLHLLFVHKGKTHCTFQVFYRAK